MMSPFGYFSSSPEIIRLAVMIYVRYPLSLRNVEEGLAEPVIDVSYEAVRSWWNCFDLMLAWLISKNYSTPQGRCR
jgi:putative transposase